MKKGDATRAFARMGLLLAVGAMQLACSAQSPEQAAVNERFAISGGEPDSTDSNVFLVVSHRGSEGVALCSSSLIAPNLLLTARHCVANVTDEVVTCGKTEASAPYAASTFFASNAQSLDDATSAYRATTISVPSQGSDICGFDLALITLASNVPASVATPIVPRIDQAVTRGEVYSAIGYGQVSPGDAGAAGARMERGGLKVSCAPGTCGTGVESSEFVGDTGICSGDSGGPALDASGKVVGVVSRSADDCAHPVYGSVAAWKDWIIGVAQQAATQGRYEAPFWVTSGSSNPATSSADAGAAGAASTGPVSVVGDQGDKCGAPSDCITGYGCYSPDSQATNAYCAAYCTASSSSSCASGTRCDTGVGVCVSDTQLASASGASSSCALSVPGGKRVPISEALLSLAVCAVVLARRRRSSRGAAAH